MIIAAKSEFRMLFMNPQQFLYLSREKYRWNATLL